MEPETNSSAAGDAQVPEGASAEKEPAIEERLEEAIAITAPAVPST